MITGQVTSNREAVISVDVRGGEVQVPVYRAEVLWHDRWRLIYVHETEGGALVGMSLLYGSVLKIRVIDGGEVTIELIV